jgi:multiple sugar transport system permease protein/raffinose/stachyose/melibiose transport system permease protein
MTVEGETAAAPLRAARRGRTATRRGRPTLARRLRRDPGAVIMFLVLIVVCIVMLYPFAFMIINSLRTETQYLNGSGFSTSSWTGLFNALPVGSELLNSTLICAGSIAIILIGSSAAGFAFAKLHYRRQNVIFLGIIGSMMIPVQSIIIPEYVNLSNLGLVNNYLAPILVYSALGMPFATFLMTVFFRGLPDELIEAALCDGFGYIGVFWRIAVRMAAPALATVTVLQFIQIWDDLLVALLLLQEPANRTITVGLGVISSGRAVSIPALMAGSLISALPAIIVYLIFQRYLISGLTMGVSR